MKKKSVRNIRQFYMLLWECSPGELLGTETYTTRKEAHARLRLENKKHPHLKHFLHLMYPYEVRILARQLPKFQ